MPEIVDEQIQEREHRRDIAEGLRGILAVLNSNKPLDAILDYITMYACRLLEADAVAVYRLQPETDLLKIQSSHGLSKEYLDHSTVTLGQGATGQAVNQGKPVAITNIEQALGALSQPVDPEMMVLLNILSKQFQSELSVPLIVKQDIVGTLNLYYANPRVFTQGDIDLAVSFCDQTALAIENARLREQAQQDAVAAERNRLARELHDSVTQTIFSASLIADVLPTIWERNPPEAVGALEDLRKLTRGALAEMRTLLFELRPIGLGEVGLADLLRQLAEGVSGRVRAQIKVLVEGDAILPTEVKFAFYRIAQEALNNVAKHSGADTVEIEIKSNLPATGRKSKKIALGQINFSESVSLSIRDNGRGFDPKRVIGEHLGLGIMQERALNAQVHLSIRSKPGHGTEIALRWPMPEKQSSPER
ncbi:MAG: GAF domain-containing sensor histidine kinase [Chloroflexi bacterium]|nr:GAF domain-containing sensor histidine kinase [Chloroflexota bacterium]